MGFYPQLIYLIAWILQLPTRRIVPTTELKRDLDLDDHDFQMLIFRLEDFYKVELGAEEINSIKSVRDLGQIIAAKESSARWSKPAQYAARHSFFRDPVNQS